MPMVSKSVMRNFWQAFLAVVIGNAVYYMLFPYLPARARHVPFQTDIGVLVDLWFCLVAFGLIKMAVERDRKRRRPT